MKNNNKKGFLLPPVMGYSLPVVFHLLTSYSISLKFLPRLVMTLLINLINFPFRFYERNVINAKFKNVEIVKSPVFIIGHWRSGTTHLHNILCQDPQMAYTTTFQSVFPDTLFNTAGRFLFEGFAKIMMPGTRKGDNVSLGTDLPQEEEFALGANSPFSFYYFWMFPKKIKQFYSNFIACPNTMDTLLTSWKKDYNLLIKKAIKNTNRQRFLSKNPPNTGRIAILLQMFPDARFIYIHRNPIAVYLSTQNFFNKMLPYLQLQDVDPDELNERIFEIYKDLMEAYLHQKHLIPKDHLIEIDFDQLERDPLNCIRKIYKDLSLPDYKVAEKHFISYLDKMKNYEKNKHEMSQELINRINKEWGFAMKKWNYDIPSHIHVSKNSKE